MNLEVPMYGQVTINWSAGVDENGVVAGYIGVPELPGELLGSEGTTLAFQEPITGYSDDTIAKGVRLTMQTTLNKEVLPQIVGPMFDALVELRERAGGYMAQDEAEPEA